MDKPTAPKPAQSYSPRRINALARALGGRTYLEIGVSTGKTFFAVELPDKTAVDPKFRFDVAEAAQTGGVFNEITSDAFFATLDLTQKYDIIFLDGLHTFEQTYRDFCNSLAHAHDKTVFLIDDTYPNDVYSAHPVQRKAVGYRRQAGGDSSLWHGDVYKTVLALHDFHPAFNYRTLFGSGNPQTLVWRSNSGWREPRFNSFEKISRADYFDLLDNMDLLRTCAEKEAIALCIGELAGL